MDTSNASVSGSMSSFITAREIQQDYMEAFGHTDWNRFGQSNIFLIKQKIAFAIYGLPGTESGDLSSATAESTYGYSAEQLERVLPIYEKICQLKNYSADHESIFMSIIFVCCVPHKAEVTNIHVYDNVKSDKINVTPVFRIRKCVKEESPSDGCCIFIDDIGRVYKNWSLYLKNNKQPKGIVVAPANGRYHGLISGDSVHVDLDVVLSPASSVFSKMHDVANYVCTGVSVGAVGVLGVSVFSPITAGVVTATSVATGVTGLYGMVTSSGHLIDRKKHHQSISLLHPKARSCWLNLGASATGLIAGVSSRFLARAAGNGATIATGFRLTHDTAIVMAALTSGAGLANTITNSVIKYNKTKEGPTSLEIFQIASSLFFFTNSIVSNKMAHTIIEETENSQISAYRDSLSSNCQREIYDKIVAETCRINGGAKGNSEVIKGILKIENKDQFFQDALQLNKQLNQHKVRIAMKDGQVLLNGEHIINPQEFYNPDTQARATDLSSIRPKNLSANNLSTNLPVNIKSPLNVEKLSVLAILIVQDFPNLSVASNDDILQYVSLKICALAKYFNVYKRLIKILKTLLNHLNTYTYEQLQALGINEYDLFYRLFIVAYGNFRNICGDPNAIISFIKNMFINGELNHIFVKDSLKYFQNKLTIDYRNNVANEVETRCLICNGQTFSKD